VIWPPHRLPAPVRGWAYGLAVAVLLYLCLAPVKDLPPETLWDKAEHAIAWFVLTAIGLTFWPWRPGRVAGFALALGALVEVLQAAMPLGRDGDWRDWIADSVGVAAALLIWAVARRLAGAGSAEA
jgi:VanZ family protein